MGKCKFAKYKLIKMKYKPLFYIGFFVILLSAFLFFVLKDYDFSKSTLGVINAAVPEFRFTNQDGKIITQNSTDDKVYVAEYFLQPAREFARR